MKRQTECAAIFTDLVVAMIHILGVHPPEP